MEKLLTMREISCAWFVLNCAVVSAYVVLIQAFILV